MANHGKASIVVPVYNLENYLKKCIDSITNQTYKNIEVVLVDDGSTDGSGNICDDYAANDERIVVIHKSNAGVSEARNTALAAATGDYIAFCDADDYLESDYIEKMLDGIVRYGADIAACGLYMDYEKKTKVVSSGGDTECLTVDEAVGKMFEKGGMQGYTANKLFTRDAIKEIRFPTNIPFCEDTLFLTEALVNSQRIVYIPEPMYHYLQRTGSASGDMDLRYDADDNNYNVNMLVSILNKCELSDKSEHYIKGWIYIIAVGTAKWLDKKRDSVKYKKLEKYIKEYWRYYWFNNSISASERFRMLIHMSVPQSIRLKCKKLTRSDKY